MPLSSPASRRYAKALVEAVSTQGDEAITAAVAELNQFSELMKSSFDLRNALLNPVFTQAEASKVLREILAHLKLSTSTSRFLELVASRGRLNEVEAIAEAVRRLADARANRARAEVSSAVPLSKEAQDKLKKALEKRTGRNIELVLSVDPTLLGGIRARIGSIELDGTIRRQLTVLSETLAEKR